MLSDAHNHLHDKRLKPYLAEIIDRLKQNGITQCVVNGTHPDDWDDVLELHQQYPELIIPALGLHPWRVKDRPDNWFHLLENYQKLHPYIAIGECGLDRWIQKPDKVAQQDCFLAQLDLATRKNLPISIHCLKAWGALLEILQATTLPKRGIHIHGFGGSKEVAQQLMSFDTHFSFCGYFLHQRKAEIRDIFKSLPDQRLMIETDGPDMLPPEQYQAHQLPNQLNSPANLKKIAQALADIRETSFEHIATLTRVNMKNYFTISS